MAKTPPAHGLASDGRVLIHHYFGVDYDLVWDAVTTKVPPLKAMIEEILQSSDDSP